MSQHIVWAQIKGFKETQGFKETLPLLPQLDMSFKYFLTTSWPYKDSPADHNGHVVAVWEHRGHLMQALAAVPSVCLKPCWASTLAAYALP